MEKEFDIALSFAGEDREYVDKVALKLKEYGIDVFYDNFFEIDLWGKDLYQYLNDLYKNRAIYTIIFISKSYKDKLWSRHELKSAQTRAFSENYEYILPVRFDNTDLPGVNSTTGYLDLKNIDPNELADKIQCKLIESEYFDKTKLTNSIFDGFKINDGWNESTTYFHYEFSRAFPELERPQLFTDKKEIHHRLAVLLNNPTAIGSSDSAHDPIWFFRGNSAIQIDRFKVIDDNSCLLNYDELNIKSLYAFTSGTYWQDYIYIVLNPQEQTGIENFSNEQIQHQIETRGYADECFGFYKGQYLKYQEVANGHYVRNGKVHPISGKAETRFRYLSEYSFFIGPKAGPLNIDNHKVQLTIQRFCSDNLAGIVTIEQFNKFYTTIPRIDQRYK